MITKLFEIRDAGTMIPVLAVKLLPRSEPERFLLRHSGFGGDQTYVVLHKLQVSVSNGTWDAYQWDGGSRTMRIAHKHIEKNFDKLASGAVVDVQHILGETEEPKISERLLQQQSTLFGHFSGGQ